MQQLIFPFYASVHGIKVLFAVVDCEWANNLSCATVCKIVWIYLG